MLSGIWAGIVSLIAAFLVWKWVYTAYEPLDLDPVSLSPSHVSTLLTLAIGTIILTALGVFYFSSLEAKKRGQKLWASQSKRAFINLFIPLFTGGTLCLLLLAKGYLGFMAPLTLIFSGLAQVNASNNTYREIRVFGVIQVILGLLAISFAEFGLWFWATGFGLVNILSGLFIYRRYNA